MFRIPKIKAANSTCQLPIWAVSVSYQFMWSKSNKGINEQTKTGKVTVLQKKHYYKLENKKWYYPYYCSPQQIQMISPVDTRKQK